MSKKEEQSKAIEPERVATGAPVSNGEPVIQTIPEKFYGAALKAKLVDPGALSDTKKDGKKPSAALSSGPKKGMGTGVVIIALFVLLGGAGGLFVYFNQDLIFPPPEEEPDPLMEEDVLPPPPPPPPSAPSDLTATSTNPTVVQLSWVDTSEGEAGFRVERRIATSEYRSLTSLPPNATAFQDNSVQADTSYLYRIIALSEGGESPASNEVTVTTLPTPPPPPEQPTLPPAGLDSDSDGLTDLEEPLYGTSPRDPDADNDSFLDGNEVFHLYNPAGGVSVRLLESGLVKPLESPIGWTVFVPVTWKTEMSEDGMKGTVMTGHGETFIITMEPNPNAEPLMDWYLSRHPGVLSSQVVMITTKSGIDGLEGADLLTTYFPWGSMVLVFTYDLDDQPFVNFRQTYEMMKNSLSLSAEPVLPDTYVMPQEAGPSAEGEGDGGEGGEESVMEGEEEEAAPVEGQEETPEDGTEGEVSLDV